MLSRVLNLTVYGLATVYAVCARVVLSAVTWLLVLGIVMLHGPESCRVKFPDANTLDVVATWPQHKLPLVVTTTGDSELDTSVLVALHVYNSTTQTQFFTFVEGEDYPGHVDILVSRSPHIKQRGVTRLVMDTSTKRIEAASVIVSPDLSEDIELQVLLHELAHCLGVQHSEDPGSLMYMKATEYTGLTVDVLNALASSYQDTKKNPPTQEPGAKGRKWTSMN